MTADYDGVIRLAAEKPDNMWRGCWAGAVRHYCAQGHSNDAHRLDFPAREPSSSRAPGWRLARSAPHRSGLIWPKSRARPCFFPSYPQRQRLTLWVTSTIARTRPTFSSSSKSNDRCLCGRRQPLARPPRPLVHGIAPRSAAIRLAVRWNTLLGAGCRRYGQCVRDTHRVRDAQLSTL